ncbi:MAG: GGDEF domain-containing protein [Thermotogota bacterium]|nr:GGDEF domain-containing protein [Thermotogota bacterium]
MLFLFVILFTFSIDNIRINYRSFNLVSTIIPAIVIILGYGPYTAGTLIAFISLFRININHSRNKGMYVVKAFSRSAIYFLMYTLPADLMYLDFPLYFGLLLYLLSVLAINQIIMLLYFKVFYNKSGNGLLKNIQAFFIELSPGILLLPLSQTIYDLQLVGYDKIFTLYYLFPVVSITLLLFTIIMKNNDREKEERIKLRHFKQAFKGILSGLNLVRSTEDINIILQKSTKHLAEMLGYREALISVINRNEQIVNRIGYYGMDKGEFDDLASKVITVDSINDLFTPEFKFSGTYFIPAESRMFEKLNPGNFIYSEGEKINKNKWHPDDLFLIPFLDSENELIGYIALDYPLNGQRPTEEDAEIARIFAEQIGRMIETSFKYKKALETAKIDRMTKLNNHTTFYEKADKLIKTSSFEQPLSLIMMDIDGFKAFNDKYGHLMGDQALKNVAKVIKDTIPMDTIAARYGGEEFAVLLACTDKLNAVEIANRIIQKVAKTDVDGLHVTISCGVATCPEDARHSSTLVSSADSALYISKKTGKNKVTMV